MVEVLKEQVYHTSLINGMSLNRLAPPHDTSGDNQLPVADSDGSGEPGSRESQLVKQLSELQDHLEENQAKTTTQLTATLEQVSMLFRKNVFFCFVFLVRFFTGLVWLYIAGLPLRSCPDHWATFCGGCPPMSDFRFWHQQDSNPRPGHCLADVVPLCYFDPHNLILILHKFCSKVKIIP